MRTTQRNQPIFEPTPSRSLLDRPIKISNGVHFVALLLHNLSCHVISGSINIYYTYIHYIHVYSIYGAYCVVCWLRFFLKFHCEIFRLWQKCVNIIALVAVSFLVCFIFSLIFFFFAYF